MTPKTVALKSILLKSFIVMIIIKLVRIKTIKKSGDHEPARQGSHSAQGAALQTSHTTHKERTAHKIIRT
jgi:hypothetical protein